MDFDEGFVFATQFYDEVNDMLVPMRAILAAADKYRYGQGAFNMNSVGQIEAAVRIH